MKDIKVADNKLQKKFNDIIKFNWSWIYKSSEGIWTQFDCIVCMILESQYQLWLKDQSTQVEIKMGQVDFDNMQVVLHLKNKPSRII